MELKSGEKIEDLGNGLKIIQSDFEYRFTTDAVLLANLVKDLSGKRAADLGSGSGVISILLAAKKHAAFVCGLELQPQLADMARRSAELNGLTGKVQFVTGAIQDAANSIGCGFDCVVCNPPYRKCGSGERQLAENIALCRHEIAMTLAEAVQSAASILNSKGSFYLVHQSARLAEICYLMKQNKIEPKEIFAISPRAGKPANLVVVRGVANGNVGCKLHTLQIYGDDGNYTPEVASLYGQNA